LLGAALDTFLCVSTCCNGPRSGAVCLGAGDRLRRGSLRGEVLAGECWEERSWDLGALVLKYREGITRSLRSEDETAIEGMRVSITSTILSSGV